MRPTGTRVLVLRDKVEEFTPGGIHVPDQHRKPSRNATVVAVGDSDNIPESIKPTVKVVLSKMIVEDIKVDGVMHTMVDYDMGHILAVVD